jgi:hypothetical protein
MGNAFPALTGPGTMLASAYRSKEVIDASRLGGAAGRRRGEDVRRLTLQEPIHAQKISEDPRTVCPALGIHQVNDRVPARPFPGLSVR